MIFELHNEDKKKILDLIMNTKHELSIAAAVHGYAPSEVFVDDPENPKSGLFKGEECNVLFGDSTPGCGDFYWKIFEKIDYYDQVTCDHDGWNAVVEEQHVNRAIRKYNRYSYSLKREDYTGANKTSANAKVIVLDSTSMESLEYENAEMAKEWACIHERETLPSIALAAVVVVDNAIVSCSGVDCYYDNKVEIGIQTRRGFRGKGYGITAVNALVRALFDYGIDEIGWHCVSTNRGSRSIAEKLGFNKICTYTAHTPYPPIENIADLTTDEWRDNAAFYMNKAADDPTQNWIAAQCWAKANEMLKVFSCFENLAKSDNMWFLDCLDDLEEFDKWTSDTRWNDKLKELSLKAK